MRSIGRAFLVITLGFVMLAGTTLDASATFPGGNGEIAFIRFDPRTYSGSAWAINADGSDRHLISDGGRVVWDMSYSGDGTKAVVYEQTRRGPKLVLIDVATGDRSTFLAASDAPSPSLESVSMSPDGQSVVFCAWDAFRQLYTMDVDGSNLKALTWSRGMCWADWGPDDRIVASKGFFHGEGDRQIVTMDPDATAQQVIATFPQPKASWRRLYFIEPSWAPDGSSVAFTLQRNRITPDLWAVGSEGIDLRKLTDTPRMSEAAPVYSPDGTLIAFGRQGDVWLMSPDGTDASRLTDTPTVVDSPVAWQRI
jgi:Tol biopolymer transport system component